MVRRLTSGTKGTLTEAAMSEERTIEGHEQGPGGEDDEPGSPSGAVFITTVLAAVILLAWFGVYVLNLVRG